MIPGSWSRRLQGPSCTQQSLGKGVSGKSNPLMATITQGQGRFPRGNRALKVEQGFCRPVRGCSSGLLRPQQPAVLGPDARGEMTCPQTTPSAPLTSEMRTAALQVGLLSFPTQTMAQIIAALPFVLAPQIIASDGSILQLPITLKIKPKLLTLLIWLYLSAPCLSFCSSSYLDPLPPAPLPIHQPHKGAFCV